MVVLIVNVCKEKLHYYEFVKPIEDLIGTIGQKYLTKNYQDINEQDLVKAQKVIICGTSIKDSDYIKNIEQFSWIKKFDKPLLGICAGMQVVGVLYGGKIQSQLEIGYYHEDFEKEFLGLKDEVQVYHLHQDYVSLTKEFEVYSTSKIIQAAKHKKKEFYVTLFHPEVRNKELIKKFVLL